MRAHRIRTCTVLAVAAPFLAACGAGISYNSDHDPQVDFAPLRSYVWATVQEGQNRGVNEMLERRIMAAFDQQLQAKGYTKATSGGADFAVNFVVTTSEQTDYNTYYTGMGYGRGWYGGVGMATSHTTATTYTNGTLVLDVFDMRTKNLIWRGTAKGTVDPEANSETREARIQEATAGILKQFPSRPGAGTAAQPR